MKPPPHSESVPPSPSQVDDSLVSKPSFLVPSNPSRREHYEGRFPPAGPGRMASLDGRFSFHRSNSSRSSSAGGSSDWSSYHGFMEAGPDARQEWLRMTNVTSPSDYSWGTNREAYDRGSGQMCMEKIIAGGSQSSSPSPRPEVALFLLFFECSSYINCLSVNLSGGNDLDLYRKWM